MDYSYYGGYETAGIDSAMTAGIALTSMLGTLLLVLLIFIFSTIGMWKMFKKAGEAGWKSLIPIYNTIILFKISGLSPWFVLAYFLCAFIPFIGSLAVTALTVYLFYKLSASFGHGAGYTVGLFFLAPIFYMILGFGSSQYIGQKA